MAAVSAIAQALLLAGMHEYLAVTQCIDTPDGVGESGALQLLPQRSALSRLALHSGAAKRSMSVREIFLLLLAQLGSAF